MENKKEAKKNNVMEFGNRKFYDPPTTPDEYLSNLNTFGFTEFKDKFKEPRVFESGAKRDANDTKPYIHNLTGYTRQRFGYHMTIGARKYGDGNWTKGMPIDQYLESIDRHLAQYMEGDRTEDHLSAIIFGVNGIMAEEKKQGIPADHYFNLSK